MKTYFLTVTLTLLSFFSLHHSFGQSQKNLSLAVSFRHGLESTGATAGLFLKKNASLQMMYTTGSETGRKLFNLLYTESFPLGNIKGMNWFGGAGVHAGWRKINGSDGPDVKLSRNGSDEPRENLFFMGATAIVGLEYYFPNIPVRLAADVKPYVDFVNGPSSLGDIALSVGFCF